MNKEKLLELADILERHEGKLPTDESITFKMSQFYGHREPCGTVACLAGFTVLLWGGASVEACKEDQLLIPQVAAEILDLKISDRRALFAEHMPFGFTEPISHEFAAKVIRNFVETGVVDWELP